VSDKNKLSTAVVFADGFFMSEDSLAEISSLGGYAWAGAKDHRDLAQKIGGSGAVRFIVSEYIWLNEEVFVQAPGLKGVIAYGAGYDHIDLQKAAERGIVVCNCRGENAQAVAELAFGLLMSLMRKVRRADTYVRQGKWRRAESASLPGWATGGELWQKTLGIIGLGQIGRRMARMARGFDMKILAHDPFAGGEEYSWVEMTPLDVLLAKSDVVTLHIPLTPATEKLINAQTLSKMKPTALLVNTSRGRVIDEPALLKALRDRRIAGAALDVFSAEPLPTGHPLAKMENVVLSPHMGAMTHEAGERLSAVVTRQVRDILSGRKPECQIAP
jgi:phosphoglycerate dehydrogenase-like enzyme